MSHLYSNTSVSRKKYSHLSYKDRQKLEGMVRSNHLLAKRKQVTQKHMATVLQCSEATVSRELKKGRVELMNSDLYLGPKIHVMGKVEEIVEAIPLAGV